MEQKLYKINTIPSGVAYDCFNQYNKIALNKTMHFSKEYNPDRWWGGGGVQTEIGMAPHGNKQ